MSKGILLHTATEGVPFSGIEDVATIGLAVSLEMFPIMTFIAVHVDYDGDITSDVIKIPIQLRSENMHVR